MGNRFWITGVQLGMMKAYEAYAEFADGDCVQKLIDEIIDKQYIGKEKDLKKALRGVKK